MPSLSQANYQQQGQRYQAPPVCQQPHQQMPSRENNSAIEDLILQFQQNITATIHDLKMQVGHWPVLECSPHRRFQIRKGEKSAQRAYKVVKSYHSWPSRSRVHDQLKTSPNQEPTPGCSNRPRMFHCHSPTKQKVEINISLLNAIKQIPKYAKFLKELCVHKRKGTVETGGVVSLLVRHKDTSISIQRVLARKCQDPDIFIIPCTIGDRTFTDAMLDLRASINVMLASIYRSLNLGDLEPTGMVIQLANKNVVQPLGILEDVIIRVNELIFLGDFYVLDMEDEASREGSTLILE
ncbi:hypothetical protein CR513_01392, partial [Mucuna pruriens]